MLEHFAGDSSMKPELGILEQEGLGQEQQVCFMLSASSHPIWAMGMELEMKCNMPARYLPFLIWGFG